MEATPAVVLASLLIGPTGGITFQVLFFMDATMAVILASFLLSQMGSMAMIPTAAPEQQHLISEASCMQCKFESPIWHHLWA